MPELTRLLRPGGTGRRASWLLLFVVLAVALFFGSRAGGGPAEPQRLAALYADIRCPSCADLSVAESNDPTAVAVRQAVRREVRTGWSDSQIEAYLVARYGQGILLRPLASGASSLVWVLPPVVAAAAGAGVGLLFYRRRRAGEGSGPRGEHDDVRLVEAALGERTGAGQ
jgi:cytochrome c-type biogenesis protein CcmH